MQYEVAEIQGHQLAQHASCVGLVECVCDKQAHDESMDDAETRSPD